MEYWYKHFTLTIDSITFSTLTNRIEADLDKIFLICFFFAEKIILKLIKNSKTKPKK